MRRFFIDQRQLRDPIAWITGSDARHIKNVLRLKPGTLIGLFDGQGHACEAEIIKVSTGKVEVAVRRRFTASAESSLQITVAQGFLKERKMDGLVRQLTELGISRWVPFTAERSVSRPNPDRLNSRLKRWEKIAREAVKQCRRGRVPEIGDLISFTDMLEMGNPYDLKIVFWEKETEPLSTTRFSESTDRYTNAFIVLGPEGGLTDQEAQRARELGFVTAALGPRILKAETATVAACVIVQFLFGDMGQKNLDKDQGV